MVLPDVNIAKIIRGFMVGAIIQSVIHQQKIYHVKINKYLHIHVIAIDVDMSNDIITMFIFIRTLLTIFPKYSKYWIIKSYFLSTQTFHIFKTAINVLRPVLV